jgi:hypothetical protein
MIETIDGAAPPITPCPSWCDEGSHPWEYVYGEWQREHLGELTPAGAAQALEVYTFDSWVDGKLERAEPVLVADGACVTLSDAVARLLRSP